jgi:hypothetical protein
VRLLTVLLCAALVFAGAAHAVDLRTVDLGPVEDVSFPFWCDWGYLWEERCYRLDGPRLGVGGGEPDKVWRSGLRFSTAAVRPKLTVWYVLSPPPTTRSLKAGA